MPDFKSKSVDIVLDGPIVAPAERGEAPRRSPEMTEKEKSKHIAESVPSRRMSHDEDIPNVITMKTFENEREFLVLKVFCNKSGHCASILDIVSSLVFVRHYQLQRFICF